MCNRDVDVNYVALYSLFIIGMADSGVVKGAGRNKRTWTTEEDAKLVDALMELHASGKYAGADNGFKPGYLQAVQSLLDVSLPNSGLKAEPHIKSRMKTLKTNFSIVHDMLVGTHTSGFGWDPEKCCLTADDEVWDEYIKTHKNAAQFKGKAFPLYDKLSTIFGKDRATGARAVDLGDEDIVGETQRSAPIDVEDSHVGTDVPLSDGVTASASSKRKRGKSGDFTQVYQDSCMVLNDTFATFGQTLSNDFKSVAKEGTSSVDLMKKVINELEYLPSITLDERIKAMAVIGNSATFAEMFFALDMAGKVRMVQMISTGALR